MLFTQLKVTEFPINDLLFSAERNFVPNNDSPKFTQIITISNHQRNFYFMSRKNKGVELSTANK